MNLLNKAIAAAVGSSVSQAKKIAEKKIGSGGTSVVGAGGQTGNQEPAQLESGGTDWSAQMQSAMDRGASADVVEYLMSQRNNKIAANKDHYSSLGISDNDSISKAAKAYIQQQRSAQEQPPVGKYGSFQEFVGDTGYDDYAEQMKAAIKASVDQAVNGYKSQIYTTNKQSDDMARQAWVAKRLAEKNMGQQLSASGYSGGMADSQKISLESNYQGQLTDIEQQRNQTVKDLEAAITNAKLTGDMQTAQELAGMLQQIQSQWNDYVRSQKQMDQQNYWNQKELDNQNYWSEQELAAQNKGNAYTRALNLISQGFMPDEETLAAAGITRAAAQQKLDQQMAEAAAAAGTTGGGTSAVRTVSGGGYNNGSLTTEQVKQLQRYYNVSADGLWGSNSKAAAGGMTADEAWAAYQGHGNNTSMSFSRLKDQLSIIMSEESPTAAAKNIQTLIDQYWDQLSTVQQMEVNDLLKRYGFTT